MSVGKSIQRVDVYDKVTGRAKYADDLTPGDALVATVVRSTIANGRVKSFDIKEATEVVGVVKILTCFDVPGYQFPTAGHPWSTDTSHQDVADRLLLNERVRIYGDDIAVVIAENEIAGKRAASLVKVEYEEYDPVIRMEDALKEGAAIIHEEYPQNILKHTASTTGEKSFEEVVSADKDLIVYENEYETQAVQHCHIEPPMSFAYMERGRIVVTSSTQIPHIVRRVIGQALGIPWGKVRVIKPVVGGGFGNKQEVLYEPLNAWLTTEVGGRPVKLELSREETMANTRTRHAMKFVQKSAVNKEGRLVARKVVAKSNQGGYASHGHAIVANAGNVQRMLYQDEKSIEVDCSTIYTNIASGGAMRGYGIPQSIFALESNMDDLARLINMDPIEFRKKNWMKEGFVDSGTGITCHSSGLAQCVEAGSIYIGWKEKRERYKNQKGSVRKGVGMSIFCYKSGVYPISLETASCRMILNQDGSIQVQVGATEIGQGADTVFTQMASEATHLPLDMIHLVSNQDTDVTPFDTGAYASRQTYVTGQAVKQTGELLKNKILQYAGEMLNKDVNLLNLTDGNVVDIQDNKVLIPVSEVAIEAFYSLEHSVHITAETTYQCKDNTYAFGACFAEIEIDIPVGKIKVLDVINVHDSGKLINPALAEGQVHGGMSMGLGYGLSEKLIFGEDGRLLNDNLLDYKLPTAMDTPELVAGFVETNDPTGPYGNKALGEPPAIPVAPAIRNALLHATGIGVNELPLAPGSLVKIFDESGLLKEVDNYV